MRRRIQDLSALGLLGEDTFAEFKLTGQVCRGRERWRNQMASARRGATAAPFARRV